MLCPFLMHSVSGCGESLLMARVQKEQICCWSGCLPPLLHSWCCRPGRPWCRVWQRHCTLLGTCGYVAWSCPWPWLWRVQRGRKMLDARQDPCRTSASPSCSSRYSAPVLSGLARHHGRFWPSPTHTFEHPTLSRVGGWPSVS